MAVSELVISELSKMSQKSAECQRTAMRREGRVAARTM